METTSRFKIRRESIRISEFLSDSFNYKGRTDLNAICEDEGLQIIVDNYGNHFDGMLTWLIDAFSIHLNSFKNNTPDTRRGRFTLAHELGHYFIDYHREAIRDGIVPPHPSSQVLVYTDRMEQEADYFAACLLMPRERLRRVTAGRRFSLDIIKEVSDVFDVSLTASLLRFAEIGTHDVLVVFSQENRVIWSVHSYDFPKLVRKFQKGGPLPPTSVVGESFRKSDAQYTGVESVDLEDWFEYRGWEPGRQLYEQCCYSDTFNFAVSLVWFQ